MYQKSGGANEVYIILPLGSRVIYALVDPRDGVVKYVGVTDNPQHRYREHVGRERKSNNLKGWLDELKAEGVLPMFVFLDSVKADAALAKENEWIAHFQKIFPLFNFKKR